MTFEDSVIKNDFCSGCGVCAYVQPDKFEMKFDPYEMIKAHVLDDSIPLDDRVNLVCPFSNEAQNEDALARELFPDAVFSDESLGRYNSTYVGFVNEGEFRDKGGSGGTGKWLLRELLNRDLVDYVIQVAPEVVDGELFSYRIFRQGDDLINGAKSAYYPITMDKALAYMKENEGRYAVTAVPCFAKALRNLADNDEVIRERLSFVVGIICGHLKSAYFAKLLGWQVGVHPDALKGIDFRGEMPGGVANDKALRARSNDGQTSAPTATRSLLGGNWGHNFFRYKACDYCDDLMAETADIVIGDAWLPQYIEDPRGHNVIVCRNPVIDELLLNAQAEGRISIEAISSEEVVESQPGGFRDRREGLNYRVGKARANGEWVPDKRFVTVKRTPFVRKHAYDARMALREKSSPLFKEALEKNDLSHFTTNIQPLIQRLENMPKQHPLSRFAERVYFKLLRMLTGA